MIIILSQEEGYNAAQAKLLESEIIQQSKALEKVRSSLSSMLQANRTLHAMKNNSINN